MKISLCYEMFHTKNETYSNLWSKDLELTMKQAKTLAILNIPVKETEDLICDSVSIVRTSGNSYKTLATYCPQSEEWEICDAKAA